MITFEVFINGKKVTTAGVADYGVLSAILSWVKRRQEKGEELSLNIGGLVSNDLQTEHLNWLQQDLKVGDEIVIKIVDAEKADPVASRTLKSAEADAEGERRYYEHLKQKYEK